MKKIFLSILAVAAVAACTKSEVAYEPTDEIGFQVVTGKMTKAAVSGTEYPTDLNMYVFAMTADGDGSADYLNNAEFAKVSTQGGKNLWGGWKDGAADPHYWPNVKTLHFAGISKSGNVNNTVVPTYAAATGITVGGYVSPNTNEDNDLMWFPRTVDAYGKGTEYVPVVMKHACSWVTIKLAGDEWTAGKYTITDIHIEGLTTKGTATLGAEAKWELSTDPADTGKEFTVFSGQEVLSTTATAEGFENTANNTIVLPNQVPGTLSITYQFESQAEETIEETVTGSLKFNGETKWAPGTHYTYTVTITASQILIAPEVDEWDPHSATDTPVTVE